MKKLIKTILPQCIIVKAVALHDMLHLGMVSTQVFDAQNLRSAAHIELSDIYSSAEITQIWDQDAAQITEIYGNDDNYGGVNPGDRRALYYLIMALKPQNALEVGTHICASTLHIACALKQLNENGAITTLDIVDVNHPQTGPWKSVGLPKSPETYAQDLECRALINFKIGPCQDFMKSTDQRYDFIFLDGDHSAKSVYEEMSCALPLLNEGGVILLHDYYPGGKALYPDGGTITGPYKAMERIKAENPSISVLPLGALPWPTKLGTNLTSLALVVKS